MWAFAQLLDVFTTDKWIPLIVLKSEWAAHVALIV